MTPPDPGVGALGRTGAVEDALTALIVQAERDAQAHREEAAKALLHGNEQSARLHGTLGQVHHWFAVEIAKARLRVVAPQQEQPMRQIVKAAFVDGGCHHCNEPHASGLCWWCGKPQTAVETTLHDASRELRELFDQQPSGVDLFDSHLDAVIAAAFRKAASPASAPAGVVAPQQEQDAAAAMAMADDWLRSTPRERSARRMQATPIIAALRAAVVDPPPAQHERKYGIPSQCGAASLAKGRCLFDYNHEGRHSWAVDPPPDKDRP